MPFDLVYIDRFENSHKLLLRNIIGRAGRSTIDCCFDYGIIVVRDDNKSDIRKLIDYQEKMNDISLLDSEDLDEEYVDYRDAIKNNDFSDEFNLPNSVIKKIEKEEKIFIELEKIKKYFTLNEKIKIYNSLSAIYKYVVLPKRDLTRFENELLNEANRFILYRYKGMKLTDVSNMEYINKRDSNSKYSHGFFLKYSPIPNTKLEKSINLFNNEEPVDYDVILYNIYDFYDKLIDLKLIDIYYVTFIKYYEQTKDEFFKDTAIRMKFGTNIEKEIMMLRYGFSSDDFKWLDTVIDHIDEQGIIFNEEIKKLDSFKKGKIEKFIY